MRKFFYPDSLVVVGVAPLPLNMGRNVLENLRNFGYRGKVYCVGIDGGPVDGYDIYPSVSSLPEPVDLAAVLTPAKAVPGVIRECGEKGIRRAAIMTAGFAELSDERRGLQEELVATAQRYSVRFVGPNCLGIVCMSSGLTLPFGKMNRESFRGGAFSLLSQSGSVAQVTSWTTSYEGLGMAKFVSMGNKANMDEVDLLPYFTDEDDETQVVGVYLEGMTRGRQFLELARQSSKPIIVLKANISEETEHAAKSHTASLATDDRIVEGTFRQAGITRVTRVRDFATTAKALGLPLLRGNNIGVIASTGGMSVTATDACFRHGFHLPSLPPVLAEALRERARAKIINYGNPIDLGDGMDNKTIIAVAEQFLEQPEIDGLVFSPFHRFTAPDAGPDTLGIIERVAAVVQRLQKPVVLSFMAEPQRIQELKPQSPFPVFSDIEESIAALATLRDYSRFRLKPAGALTSLAVDKDAAAKIIANAVDDHRQDIGPDAMALLAAYGLPTAGLHFAQTPDEAVTTAGQIGFPVVLKAVAPGLSHKSDVGGVALNLVDGQAVRNAFATLQANLQAHDTALSGVVVQRMAIGGHELILGAQRDSSFGPVVMFGLGGIFTEVFQDVSFRLAPLSRQDAEEMIWEVKGSRLLKGVRGQPPADVAALVTALQRLGQLIAEHQEIKEIDVNPIKVFSEGSGVLAVDARVVLG